MAAPAILILGASGAIGRFLLPRLDGHGRVRAVSRQPQAVNAAGGVSWIQHDLETGPVPCAARVLISTGPLRFAVDQAAACEGLRQVIAFSSASVLFKRQSPDTRERKTMESLLAAEQALAEGCRSRGIALTLFRPCMIYGAGMDTNVARLAGLSRRLPIMPVAGRGLRQPVHADDLAAITLVALENSEAAAGTFALGGGEVLDYVQMLRRIGARRVIRVPAWLLAGGLGLAHLAGCMRDIRAVMLRRQAQDLVVDDSPARAILGWAPRPFHPW